MQKIVHQSRIEQFNEKHVNYKQKYKVEWNEKYYDAIIIAVGDMYFKNCENPNKNFRKNSEKILLF